MWLIYVNHNDLTEPEPYTLVDEDGEVRHQTTTLGAALSYLYVRGERDVRIREHIGKDVIVTKATFEEPHVDILSSK